MTPSFYDASLNKLINNSAVELENHLQSDVIAYHGPMAPELFSIFRDFIEEVKAKSKRTEDTISVVLRTGGGSAEATERMVTVLRKHYRNVNFIVPEIAMSAGTIFCMSGDKIYMDYSSSLGPIDPQVLTLDSTAYVPALGYLDKVDEISSKSALLPADVVLLKSIDLARLALYEQARDLSIELLKKWLVQYKFSGWVTHRTTNPGTPVTDAEKAERAEQIARDLADHKKWRSHGRNLDLVKLKELKIEIDDYTSDADLSDKIKAYNETLQGYIGSNQLNFYFHHHLV